MGSITVTVRIKADSTNYAYDSSAHYEAGKKIYLNRPSESSGNRPSPTQKEIADAIGRFREILQRVQSLRCNDNVSALRDALRLITRIRPFLAENEIEALRDRALKAAEILPDEDKNSITEEITTVFGDDQSFSNE